MIDSGTKLYGLIGNPVAGSRSPWIHNRVFEDCGIPGAYLTFAIAPEKLESAIYGLKALGIGGLNVTIPYKTAVIPLLDSVDPMAEFLGAVNTIVCEDNHWRGYNTDGPGLLAVLNRHIHGLEQRKILVLGAGGAARGICGALVFGGVCQVGIWNRSPEKAQQLSVELRKIAGYGQTVQTVESAAAFAEYDLVINTTSVGMDPEPDHVPVPVALLGPGAAVCDIVYKPHRTKLLREAEAAGHPVIYGIEMLIEQALLAEQLWNGLGNDDLAPIRARLIEEFECLHK